jgi:hypothetical protein
LAKACLEFFVFFRAPAYQIAENPAGRFMIRSRTRVVQRHPQGKLVSGDFGTVVKPRRQIKKM